MRPTCTAANKRLIIVVCTIAVFASGSLAQAMEPVVTLKFQRKAANGNRFSGMQIYVNGNNVGTVANGKTEEFKVVPKSDGKNTISVILPDKIGKGKVTSKEYPFTAHLGGVVNAVSTLVFDADAKPVIFVKLDITVEKEGFRGEVLSVRLDKEMKSVVLKKSPPLRPAKNTEKVVEDIVKVKHSVTIAEGWKAEAEVKGTIQFVWAHCESGIKAGIEKSTSKTYGVETERKRSVTLKGDGSSAKVRVVWVEYYRTGTATVKVDGKEVIIPFEFKEDFDLLTEDAD